MALFLTFHKILDRLKRSNYKINKTQSCPRLSTNPLVRGKPFNEEPLEARLIKYRNK